MARRRPANGVVCPLKCSGGRADRQSYLSDGQLERLPADARERIEGSGGAQRCTYCGAVYLPGGAVLGSLDNGVLGEGWHPFKR